MSDKIKKEIFNGVGENVRALAQLFPSTVKDGEVDFAALKQELGEFVEVGAEKYDFTWAGKAKAKAESVSDILGRTLKYIKGDGVNEDTTQNLYIEGDNLEALKLLRNSYYNKIKMIYIDPPYNTGNDFVYKDNFAMTEEEKLAMAEAGEEVDEYGERLVKNNSDNSKYHTNWLNMIYPRLKIARDLLTDDGVIFISIDNNEISNLNKACDEILGENNKLGLLVRRAKTTSFRGNYFAPRVDYILVYSRTVMSAKKFRDKVDVSQYNKIELSGNRKGEFYGDDTAFYLSTLETRPNQRYFIECPDGELVVPPGKTIPSNFKDGEKVLPKNGDGVWRWENSQYFIKKGSLSFKKTTTSPLLNKDGGKAKWNIYTKIYLRDKENDANIPSELLMDFINRQSSKELKELDLSFDFAKPIGLIKFLISIIDQEKDITVLDFFSGSATTAHAVMQLNAEDGGNRKYICVQLPEPCAEDSEAFKAGYKNICEIGKERIRRAGKKIAEENQTTVPNLDIGFKVFKVADTNIRMFSNELNNVDLFGQIDIKDIAPEQIDFNNGATDLDVCYELLLRHRGIPLSSKVDKLSIGERTYIIADSIVVCLEQKIAESLVEQLAAIDPLPNKYIFRDSSFGDDISLKENTMIYLQAIIEKNSGASKKAYTVEFI